MTNTKPSHILGGCKLYKLYIEQSSQKIIWVKYQTSDIIKDFCGVMTTIIRQVVIVRTPSKPF